MNKITKAVDLEELKPLVEQIGAVGLVSYLVFPDGLYKYMCLIDNSMIDEFADDEGMRKFYLDDLGYAFATVIKERRDAPTHKKTP